MKGGERMLVEKYLRVRVIKVPEGPAPLWVREQWVGLPLLAESIVQKGGEKDFLTGDFAPVRKYIRVFKEEALEVLGKKSPEAAAWFRENFSQWHPRLSFGLDEVEIIREGHLGPLYVEKWKDRVVRNFMTLPFLHYFTDGISLINMFPSYILWIYGKNNITY